MPVPAWEPLAETEIAPPGQELVTEPFYRDGFVAEQTRKRPSAWLGRSNFSAPRVGGVWLIGPQPAVLVGYGFQL